MTRPRMGPIRDAAAHALDMSLSAATTRHGIYTDSARAALAAYLDGSIRLRASTVRAYIRYLRSIA